jgi:hypothetical protein
MSKADRAGFWVADVIGAASQQLWSSAALRELLAHLATAVGARTAGMWIKDQSCEWVANTSGSPVGEILEFRSGGDGNVESKVEVFVEVDDPSIHAQELLETFGQLLLQAVGQSGPCSQAEMRAMLLRRRVGGITSQMQAGGLLAERFRTSIDEGQRRLRTTAERFEISVSGFSEGLINSPHQVALEPGYWSSNISG